ncbi:hypothetical protein BKA57DRAFT_294880 [Linnemannia elongata]|nr:hypothetical protein BKA57DRAFT_294880 [Linnemannia elongata]
MHHRRMSPKVPEVLLSCTIIGICVLFVLFGVKTMDVIDVMDGDGCLDGGRAANNSGILVAPRAKKKRLALCGWCVSVLTLSPCEQTSSALDDVSSSFAMFLFTPLLFCHLVLVCSIALPPFIPVSGHPWSLLSSGRPDELRH